MNAMLEDQLRELVRRMCGGIGQPPIPRTLLIAEAAIGDSCVWGRLRLPRSALKTPDEYSARFDELMTSDFAWLNMSYCGTLEGHGLVMIEYPRQPSVRRGTDPVPTSLNFSGPMKLVADAGWDVTAYVILVP
jgi:hypothetical protein